MAELEGKGKTYIGWAGRRKIMMSKKGHHYLSAVMFNRAANISSATSSILLLPQLISGNNEAC